MQFLKCGYNVTVWPLAKIVSPEVISVGHNVIIDDFVFLVGGRSTEIGDYVHIASFASITGGGDLKMGDFSGLSSGVRVFTGHEDYTGSRMTNPCVPFPYRKAERTFVKIGKHAVVGANAVILAGVTIGEGVAIGAGSVVLKDCEPWTIYAGVPARIIGPRRSDLIMAMEAELRAAERDIKVSVCCLTYNQAHLVKDALDGFLAQRTTFPVEILIHDDASTDGTQQILIEYAKRSGGRIKLILRRENQFLKTGEYPIFELYRIANGKYITECDGDDYWTAPLKLQKQADFLDSDPSYSMCHHDYDVEMDGKKRPPHSEPPKDFSAVDLIRYSIHGRGIGLCTRMFRNVYSPERAADVRTMAGDYAMNVYMGTFGKAKFLPGVSPSCYRRHNGTNSWSSLPRKEQERKEKEMYLRIYNWFASKGDIAHIEMRKAFL